jgi:hypothetical protein
VWFDFHHECRKMKYENLAKLLDSFKDRLEGYGYFNARLDYGLDQREKYSTKSCQIYSKQTGNFRTNCMDCLDRTNVVQSVISRNILHKQLHALGLSGKPNGSPFEKFQGTLEEAFRECWTDNANVISIIYTGTPALKTDFTRTGKRTTKGNIDDGRNSVVRYYINNYCDYYNNDCLDLATGRLKPNKASLQLNSPVSPLRTAFAFVSNNLDFDVILAVLYGHPP